MAREPLPTWFFVVAVVRHHGRFLLVHERKHNQLWYLPAGRVEAHETLIDAVVRETLEETGVRVKPVSVIRVEHSPMLTDVRVRVVYYCTPAGDTTPKAKPDDESLGAAWVGLDEIDNYPLRGEEVKELMKYCDSGRPMYPLSLIADEQDPY